jgi:hypothetical protein
VGVQRPANHQGNRSELVTASIELKEPPPYDLAKLLDEVIVAAPDLRDDARYVLLRNSLQRF